MLNSWNLRFGVSSVRLKLFIIIQMSQRSHSIWRTNIRSNIRLQPRTHTRTQCVKVFNFGRTRCSCWHIWIAFHSHRTLIFEIRFEWVLYSKFQSIIAIGQINAFSMYSRCSFVEPTQAIFFWIFFNENTKLWTDIFWSEKFASSGAQTSIVSYNSLIIYRWILLQPDLHAPLPRRSSTW